MNATIHARTALSLQALSPRTRRTVLRALLILLMALPCIGLADPPSWAPAHGWRVKNDPTYPGYSGRQWHSDYGVRSGSCDRSRIGEVLGGVLGGVAGGVIGGEVAGDSGYRDVAVVVGAVIGATIGAEVGRGMDQTDRSCVGHSLELAEAGHSVKWINPNTRVTYRLTPLDDAGRDDGCRRFRLVAHGAFGLSEGHTVACASPDGTWDLAPEARVGRR